MKRSFFVTIKILLFLSSTCAFIAPLSQIAKARSDASQLVSQAFNTQSKITLLQSNSDSTTFATSTSSSTNDDEPTTKADYVIVGAGPSGLLTAIMLSRKYPSKKIQVYDRLTEPPSPTDSTVWSDVAKFYLIGLGSRGQKALAKYGVWDDVEAVCTAVLGRKDWSPESGAEDGVERIFTDRPVNTQVLPRDKLVGVLHQHVLKNYSGRIVLNYGYEVVPEDFEANNNTAVKIRVSKCETNIKDNNDSSIRQMPSKNDGDEVSRSELCDIDNSFLVVADLLVAADGTSRTVANEMERSEKERWEALNKVQRLFAQKPFKVRRYVDDNRRVYKTIPMKIPDDWRPDLNYSARTKDGRINYDALPADRKGNYCGVLLIRESDEFAVANTDPKKLRLLLDENLPQFSRLLDDETVNEIAKKPPSYLPSFRFAGPRLNQGDYTLILGDCAHTVKPYFGLGANSALEDVKVLEEAIDSTDDIPAAVHLFSKKRAAESASLVKLSRELDRPGTLGK